LVCSVNLWSRLGNNKQPENQEVADNKEEANQGKRSERPDFAGEGVGHQLECCDMSSFSHFSLVKCYLLNITFLLSLSRGMLGTSPFFVLLGIRRLKCYVTQRRGS